jgi:antitoxin VapB
MEGSEVLIRQEGGSLVLTPIRRNRLRDVLAAWEPLDDTPMEVDDPPPQAPGEL